MFRITRPTVYPIGLDVGRACVKMVQLQQSGEQLSVLAAAKVPLRNDARFAGTRVRVAAEAVGRLLASGTCGFRGRRAIAAVPYEALHVRNLRLPVATSRHQLTAAATTEAKAALGFDPSEAAVQFLTAGEVRQGGEVRQEVIVLAVRRSAVNEFLSSLKPSGLKLDSLDVEPCALYRPFPRFASAGESDAVHALIDVGAQLTQVVIGRGHEIQFVRAIAIGGYHVEEAVSRKLGIAPDEVQALRRRLSGEQGAVDANDPVRQAANDATRAVLEDLAGQVSLCLRYHSVTFRGRRASRAELVGGATADAQLLKVLGRALPIPVAPAIVPAGLDARRLLACHGNDLGEWAVALGLALKAIEPPSAAAASLACGMQVTGA